MSHLESQRRSIPYGLALITVTIVWLVAGVLFARGDAESKNKNLPRMKDCGAIFIS